MNICLVCHENTENIVKCSSRGCTYRTHEKCHEKWDKCMHCGDFNVSTNKFKLSSKHTLVKIVDENHMNLINNYFYNAHDLLLLVKEKMATKLIIISYPNNERIYSYMTIEREEIEANNFRETFMKFHNEFRVKYIFMNDNSTEKDKSDEIWKWGSGSNLIGRYSTQIGW